MISGPLEMISKIVIPASQRANNASQNDKQEAYHLIWSWFIAIVHARTIMQARRYMKRVHTRQARPVRGANKISVAKPRNEYVRSKCIFETCAVDVKVDVILSWWVDVKVDVI